jgi:hypothetical protein
MVGVRGIATAIPSHGPELGDCIITVPHIPCHHLAGMRRILEDEWTGARFRFPELPD